MFVMNFESALIYGLIIYKIPVSHRGTELEGKNRRKFFLS